jgi:transposase
MEVLHPRCAGLDVHKDSVVVCVRCISPPQVQQVRTFAGKRRSTRIRKGGTWLKTTLVTAAWAAVRQKNSYLQSQFLRIKSRRGAKKAILAVAAPSMLTATYYMLRDGVEYRDLGVDHFDRRDREKVIARLVRRLSNLGCEVELKQAA